MSYESREDVPDIYCGTPLKGGGYCGLFHLNIYFDDVSDRCRHHFYLDGKEAVEKYENIRK